MTHVGKPELDTGAAFGGPVHTGKPAGGPNDAENHADGDGDVEMDPSKIRRPIPR